MEPFSPQSCFDFKPSWGMLRSAGSPATRSKSLLLSRKAWNPMLAYQDAVSEPVLLSTLVALVAGRAPLHTLLQHMPLHFRSSALM